MIYILGYSEEEARTRSREIAISKGCVDGTTQFWFGFRKKADKEEWILCIKEKDREILTNEEEEKIKEYAEVKLDTGWFPEKD